MIERYLRDCQRRGLAARTIESYGERLAVLQRSIGRPLHEATRDQLQHALDGRGGPASIAAHRSTAVQFWAWLVDEDIVATNVAERCKAPKVRPGVPRPIEHADLWRAMSAATDPRLCAALHLGALAGLRVAEMAGLRWPDVDLSRHLLEVTRGKGGKSRVVPMHPAIERTLRALHPARRGPVLRARTGGPYCPRSLGQLISAHFRALGIDATAHQLRHTAAGDFWEATHDIRAVSKMLGHSSVATTEVYARFDLGERTVAAVRQMAVA